jgi:hypothetical protein
MTTFDDIAKDELNEINEVSRFRGIKTALFDDIDGEIRKKGQDLRGLRRPEVTETAIAPKSPDAARRRRNGSRRGCWRANSPRGGENRPVRAQSNRVGAQTS